MKTPNSTSSPATIARPATRTESSSAAGTAPCACGPRYRPRVGDVRQAHHQHEPPAVAGLGIARHRLHQALPGPPDSAGLACLRKPRSLSCPQCRVAGSPERRTEFTANGVVYTDSRPSQIRPTFETTGSLNRPARMHKLGMVHIGGAAEVLAGDPVSIVCREKLSRRRVHHAAPGADPVVPSPQQRSSTDPGR